MVDVRTSPSGPIVVVGGGGAVDSVFARTGAVIAVAGDYNSDLITNSSSVAGATVSDALDTLAGAVAELPLPDGSQAAPSLAFADDTTLGLYRTAGGMMGFARSDFTGLEFGNATITNLDPISPAVVRYLFRAYTPAIAGANETAIFYSRLTYDAADPQKAFFYVEIEDTQIDTYGPAMKVIHDGHGDAFYVALFNDGVAFEAATFQDGSRGIISTVQIATGNENCVLFNGLWEWDTVPNFGMYYADGMYANAFVAHKRASAVDGQTWLKLIENITAGGGRIRFAGYNDGAIMLQSLASDAGNLLRESPEQRWVGSLYNGGADRDCRFTAKVVPTNAATGAYELRFYYEYDGGGAALFGSFTSDHNFDLQNGSIVNVATLQSLTQRNDYIDGLLAVQLEQAAAVTDGDTALLLRRRQGGGWTASPVRVTEGAIDSGGAGYRVLRVPN